MAFTGNLLEIYNGTGSAVTIDGVSYANGSYVPIHHFTKWKLGFKKLWSADSGRSMTGENKGTLVGIFPKLELEIGNLTQQNAKALTNLFAQTSTDVKYYDEMADAVVTASFYFGDVDVELMSKSSMRHKTMSISIIANRKRV